jgi:hypothetical membrane protein
MSTRSRSHWLAIVAIAGVSWWVLSVIFLHFITADNYRPVEQPISDMTHGPYGLLVDIGLITLGVGTLALAAGLYLNLRTSVVAPALLGVVGLLWIVIGIFQTGPGGEFEADTSDLEATIHDSAAVASFLLSVVVAFLFARVFRREDLWAKHARFTFIFAVLLLAAFLLFPVLGDDQFGLSQRIFIGILMIWLLATAYRLWTWTSTAPQQRD